MTQWQLFRQGLHFHCAIQRLFVVVEIQITGWYSGNANAFVIPESSLTSFMQRNWDTPRSGKYVYGKNSKYIALAVAVVCCTKMFCAVYPLSFGRCAHIPVSAGVHISQFRQVCTYPSFCRCAHIPVSAGVHLSQFLQVCTYPSFCRCAPIPGVSLNFVR